MSSPLSLGTSAPGSLEWKIFLRRTDDTLDQIPAGSPEHASTARSECRKHMLEQTQEVTTGQIARPIGEIGQRTRRLGGPVERADLVQQSNRIGARVGFETARRLIGAASVGARRFPRR